MMSHGPLWPLKYTLGYNYSCCFLKYPLFLVNSYYDLVLLQVMYIV